MHRKPRRLPATMPLILIPVLALITSGCLGPIEPPAEVLCDCPNLERIVGTLNWLPDTPNSIVSTPTIPPNEAKEVRVKILTASADTAFETVADRLTAAGLTVQTAEGSTFSAAGQGYSIVGLRSDGTMDGSQLFSVTVLYEGADDQADQHLAPLINTLGHQDPTGIKFCGPDTACAATTK